MDRQPTTYFARFELCEYERDPKTNYYQCHSKYTQLPDELRVEPVRVEEKYKVVGVSEFLTSRQVEGVTAFKTGLQRCSKTRYFFSGDIDEGNGKKSLVAVAFSLDKQRLCVFVFRGFWKEHLNPRLRYVEDFLTHYFNKQQR